MLPLISKRSARITTAKIIATNNVWCRSIVLSSNGKIDGNGSKDKSDTKTTTSTILDATGKPVSSVNFILDGEGELLPERMKNEPVANPHLSNSENLSIIIKNMIKTTGPIPISGFMKQCLINPEYGYYTTRNPLDAKTGDFVTSPEISSTFGEICGLWFFSTFLLQLKYQATFNRESFKIEEKKFRIIEFGPGKGTLMNDIVRTLNRFIKDKNPIEIVFIEKSDVLIQEQYKTLCDSKQSKLEKKDEFSYRATSRWGNEISWLKDDKPDLGDDKNYMNFVMAHEFFDALPMNKFIKTDNGWREYLVDIRPEYKKDELLSNVKSTATSNLADKKNSEFVIIKAPYATASTAVPKMIPRFNNLPTNSEVEVSPESHSYIYEMAEIIKSSDIGAGLVIDYGSTTIPVNTLRGIKDHKFVNPLDGPGEVDLSIDVDFGNLSSILKDLKFETHVAEQGDWLNEMGLGYRIDQLMTKYVNDAEMKKKLTESYKRLTGKGLRDMGKIYKVLGYFDSKYKETKPPGFGSVENEEFIKKNK